MAAKAAASRAGGGGKAISATIRLLIGAGEAKPAPPVGPALGQAGLNIMAFCKDFNAATAGVKVCWERGRRRRRGTKGGVPIGVGCASENNPAAPLVKKKPTHASTLSPTPQDGVPIPVMITAYTDKSYTYVRKRAERERKNRERGEKERATLENFDLPPSPHDHTPPARPRSHAALSLSLSLPPPCRR